jgi:hypothetical protein
MKWHKRGKKEDNRYNSAKLILDKEGDLYLKVEGRLLDKPVYFKVELFASENVKEKKNLTKQEMIVNLKGRE